MQTCLTTQSPQITASLQKVRTLRLSLQTTAKALHETRTKTALLIPAVADSIRATRAIHNVQSNLHALRHALSNLQLVLRAPADVTALLSSGEYAAAISAVQTAKAVLADRTLAPVLALAPARAKLARAAEQIDAALREQFRAALQMPPGKEQRDVLDSVVRLVGSMGRLPLLRGFFLKEIRAELERTLRDVPSLIAAAKAVKDSAGRALMLITIINSIEEKAAAGGADGTGSSAKYLRDVLDGMEEMLASAADRFLTADTGGAYVAITEMSNLSDETCFDEFKAALKFGEEVRSLERVATELEEMFGSEKRGSALRAKISERQIAFVGTFHRAHVDALTYAVHADPWTETSVPTGALRLLAAVVRGAGDRAEGNGKGEGAVVIGADSFKTVVCGVRYLRSMCAYTLLAEKAPKLAQEIARRATELSRLFNSLVGKAILGLAALKWSGLRSITARHLSLASRTVAMAAALADHVNRPLEKALSGAQAGVLLPLIQKSEKDLRHHHGQLLAKILAIMMDRLKAHEGVLKSLPWDKAQEMQRFDVPSAYITTLVKEATVLHRILWSILPKTEVFDIFQRVCAAYGTHLTEAYGSLDGGKKWVRSRVAEDVTCLHERLVSLDVFKANPTALKPVTKLYNRFAKEYRADEAAMGGDRHKPSPARTFIRKREEEQRPTAQAPLPIVSSSVGEPSAKNEAISRSDSSDNAASTEPPTGTPTETPDPVAHAEGVQAGNDGKARDENVTAEKTESEKPPADVSREDPVSIADAQHVKVIAGTGSGAAETKGEQSNEQLAQPSEQGPQEVDMSETEAEKSIVAAGDERPQIDASISEQNQIQHEETPNGEIETGHPVQNGTLTYWEEQDSKTSRPPASALSQNGMTTSSAAMASSETDLLVQTDDLLPNNITATEPLNDAGSKTDGPSTNIAPDHEQDEQNQIVDIPEGDLLGMGLGDEPTEGKQD